MSLGSIWGAREEEPEPQQIERTMEWHEHQQRLLFAEGYLTGLLSKHGTWIAVKKELGIDNTVIAQVGYQMLSFSHRRNNGDKDLPEVSAANMATIVEVITRHMNKVDNK